MLVNPTASSLQTTEEHISFKNQTTEETQKATQHKQAKIQTLPN